MPACRHLRIPAELLVGGRGRAAGAAGDLHSRAPAAVTTALVEAVACRRGVSCFEGSYPPGPACAARPCRELPRTPHAWCCSKRRTVGRTLEEPARSARQSTACGAREPHQTPRTAGWSHVLEAAPGALPARVPPRGGMHPGVGGAPAPEAPQWSEHELRAELAAAPWQRASGGQRRARQIRRRTGLSRRGFYARIPPATPIAAPLPFACHCSLAHQQSESQAKLFCPVLLRCASCCSPASWRLLLC